MRVKYFGLFGRSFEYFKVFFDENWAASHGTLYRFHIAMSITAAIGAHLNNWALGTVFCYDACLTADLYGHKL